MNVTPKIESGKKLNTWIVILLIAPLPLVLFGLWFFKWSNSKTNYSRLTSQLLKRQNIVLMQDGVSLAKEFSHLLESAVRDVQSLALIPSNSKTFIKFYLARVSQVTRFNSQDNSVSMIPLPLYNELIHLDSDGNELLRLRNGQLETKLRRKSQCTEANLCDPALINSILKLPVGEVYFGRLMRWYTQQGVPEDDNGAYLPVAYHAQDGIFIVGIDFRYFKDLLGESTFPYEEKRNLLQSYQSGNYIYFVDSNFDMLAHPKYWHVTGISHETGKRTLPMKTDEDEGKMPLNLKAYQGERLKDYYKRLLSRSFLQKSPDLFEAPNLKGTNRVISVAPIFLSKGQFQQSGVFGHVIIGCAIDYFEEPKEQYVPYY